MKICFDDVFLKFVFRVFVGSCVKEMYIVCSVVKLKLSLFFFSLYLIVLLFLSIGCLTVFYIQILPSGLTDTERKEYPFA